MPGEVFFVFTSWEVQCYDQAAFVVTQRSTEATEFASPAAAIDELRRFSRDRYDARLQLTACNARRRFDRVFGTVDYQFLRQPGADVMRVAPTISLHERADLGTLPKVPVPLSHIDVPMAYLRLRRLLCCASTRCRLFKKSPRRSSWVLSRLASGW